MDIWHFNIPKETIKLPGILYWVRDKMGQNDMFIDSNFTQAGFKRPNWRYASPGLSNDLATTLRQAITRISDNPVLWRH